AEDGIRDFHVTGVQTCALPICIEPITMREAEALADPRIAPSIRRVAPQYSIFGQIVAGSETIGTSISGVGPEFQDIRAWGPEPRSEERRVGKGCRSRRATEHSK